MCRQGPGGSQGSCCGLCSAQLNTKRRMKRVAKKDKGGGKAAVEEPSSSIPAQEQAKLAAKQDRKKEIQVHCPFTTMYACCVI